MHLSISFKVSWHCLRCFWYYLGVLGDLSADYSLLELVSEYESEPQIDLVCNYSRLRVYHELLEVFHMTQDLGGVFGHPDRPCGS